MRLARELSLGIGAILGLQILLSMLAIALLTRMGPAIERILEENVYSGEAVEEMLAALAAAPAGPGMQGPPAAFDAAWQRARDNVTETAEHPVLAVIEAEHAAAFAGDLPARDRVVAALRQLGQINRDSMIRADVRAQRLGQAGAWAAAILGALALGLGVLAYRRLRLRLELPLEELRRTTRRIRAGNLQSRCSMHHGPVEVEEIAQNLDWLLDHWLARTAAARPGAEIDRGDDLRRLVCFLLDGREQPTVVIDASGARVAASQSALGAELPATPVDGAEAAAGWEVRAIPGCALRVLSRTRDPAPDMAL